MVTIENKAKEYAEIYLIDESKVRKMLEWIQLEENEELEYEYLVEKTIEHFQPEMPDVEIDEICEDLVALYFYTE